MSYVDPKKNAEYITYVSLRSQANPHIFQSNPTLEAGDVKIATDDGAPANLATLPVVDADFPKRVKVVVSAGETNGDNATLIFSDQAGAEWDDLTLNIQTSVRQIDELMPTGTVVVGTNNDKTGYSLSSPQSFDLVGNISGTFVGNITGSVNEVLTLGVALANKIADHVWRRTYANIRASSDGDAVAFRSPLGMLAKLVNKWSIAGNTLTVTHEDDTTSIGTQTLTGTAGAAPITTMDTD